MSTVAICLLTWNRASVFTATMDKTLSNAGMPWDELIWTDNGSEPSQFASMFSLLSCFENLTNVRYPKNMGMARGFNTSLSLARSDYVVLLGPDVIMPDGWLAKFVNYMEKIPDAGIVASYVVPPQSVPERYRKTREIEMVNGLPVLRAMPMDHYIIRRGVLPKVGYLREDFGLYGWSDVEWMYRFERILPEIGMNCYVIPDFYGDHHAGAGAEEFRLGVPDGTPCYADWKSEQASLHKNRDLIGKCTEEKFKFYSPF